MKRLDPQKLLPNHPRWARRYILAELLGRPPAQRPRPTTERTSTRPTSDERKRKL